MIHYELDRDKVIDFYKNKYNSNCYRLAKDIGVQPSHLALFLKQGEGGGAKIVLGLFVLCNLNDIDFKSFIRKNTGGVE
jgi:hypothetical protein